MVAVDMPLNLEELLDGLNWPATKTGIVSYAQDRDAGAEALDLLQALPREEYDSLEALNADLGLVEDLPGSENLWSSQPSRQI